MIVPMIKYSFLIYHKERDIFMQNLMDIGAVQVISKGAVEDDQAQKLASDVKDAKQILAGFKVRRKANLNLEENLGLPFPPLKEVLELERELDRQQHEADGFASEIELLKPWGEFDWEEVRRLEKIGGFQMRFCYHPESKFNKKWREDFVIQELFRQKGFVYFIIFQKEGEVELPVVPVALPKKKLSELKAHKLQCEKRVAEINVELNYYSVRYEESLEAQIIRTQDELSLHLANLSTDELTETKLVLVEGWCPKTLQSKLLAYLDKSKTVYLELEPEEAEEPPILLKNNRFSKLFEPIGNMFSLPAYSELDLTVFFAPFFLLFFGFCMGDAGYGTVILIVATLLKLKIKGSNRQYLTLLQLFGASTLVIGYISGTLFGLTMGEVPLFSSQKDFFLTQDQLFQTALYIGLVQILFGMGVQVYKKVIFEGWIHALNKVGWIVLSLSMLDLFVLEKMTAITGITAWVGVGLIVFFGSPKDGWLKSFGMGLADLYNITGVAGDLLSYIRLFALGASSAILGLVINNIALSAQGVPYVGIVLTIIILVVGHTANMMLAGLSAFVHPMRLTFVEFYKNVGFLGGGKPYQPLERAKEFD